jgi:hypothetical protein
MEVVDLQKGEETKKRKEERRTERERQKKTEKKKETGERKREKFRNLRILDHCSRQHIRKSLAHKNHGQSTLGYHHT